MDHLRIAARIAAAMDPIFMGVDFPAGMPMDEVVERAKKLIPARTGGWSPTQVEDGWMVGEMECEPGFYEASPVYNEYGPDDAGVKVSWEKP